MGHGGSQAVHGPLPEVGVVCQHLGHVEAVQLHLALPCELHWDCTQLGPL